MAADPMIRIVLADDHRLFLDGLLRLFDGLPDIAVVAKAANGADAVAATVRERPDILLLDIDMPDMSGFAVLDRLHATDVQSRVILLTMHDETPYLTAASRPDVHGFVLKDAAFDELIDAIRLVAAGDKYYGASATDNNALPSPLSPRERDVLSCAARGLTTRQTADRLGINIKTVETHRAHILRKLKAANMTEAVHRMDRTR